MVRIPEIPTSWMVTIVCLCLIALRFTGIDSWTTAALSMIIGYMTGKHIENITQRVNEMKGGNENDGK